MEVGKKRVSSRRVGQTNGPTQRWQKIEENGQGWSWRRRGRQANWPNSREGWKRWWWHGYDPDQAWLPCLGLQSVSQCNRNPLLTQRRTSEEQVLGWVPHRGASQDVLGNALRWAKWSKDEDRSNYSDDRHLVPDHQIDYFPHQRSMDYSLWPCQRAA